MVSIVGARPSAQEPLCKSPKAEAVRATKIAQLGGKIDPENSHSTLTAQPLRLRAGNATKCFVCGSSIKPKRASRRQKFCCYECRDSARRARNFAVSATTRRGSPAIPRSVENRALVSTSCKDGSAGRTSSIIGPRAVIEREIIAGRIWQSVVSPDGVRCEVARVRRGGP